MSGRPRVEHLERPDWCAVIVVPEPAAVRAAANTEHAASDPTGGRHATTGGALPLDDHGRTS